MSLLITLKGAKMMEKTELEALADKYQKKADTAFYYYQETGMARYDREHCKNEDMADALRMAAQAAEDHHALIAIRGEMSILASAAERVRDYEGEGKQEKALEVLDDLIAVAKIYGLIGK